MQREDLMPADLRDLYEVRNYRNAIEILATSCRAQFDDIVAALRAFRFTLADIRKPGGSESDIPKKISALLRGNGWQETRIKGDLVITKVAGGKPPKRVPDSDADDT